MPLSIDAKLSLGSSRTATGVRGRKHNWPASVWPISRRTAQSAGLLRSRQRAVLIAGIAGGPSTVSVTAIQVTNDNNVFRWYRAEWGRYTQVDPRGTVADGLYGYAGQDPVNSEDPLGLFKRKDICKLDCPELLDEINKLSDEIDRRRTRSRVAACSRKAHWMDTSSSLMKNRKPFVRRSWITNNDVATSCRSAFMIWRRDEIRIPKRSSIERSLPR